LGKGFVVLWIVGRGLGGSHRRGGCRWGVGEGFGERMVHFGGGFHVLRFPFIGLEVVLVGFVVGFARRVGNH
jgi:hypothetical protein